jgi:exo-beta-1,3-glucanase (GH17 family)
MPAYRDDPTAQNNYYDTVPLTHGTGQPHNNDIPLVSPPSAGAFQAYHSAADSIVDFDSQADRPNMSANQGYYDSNQALDPEGRKYGFANTGTATFGSAAWTADAAKRTKRSKMMMIGGGLALIGIIIIAVVVGVVVSKNNSKNSKTLSTSGSSGGGSSSNSNSTVTQTNPNDPSTFVKNPKLHQSFWGMAYTPAGSQLPDCGNSLSEVIQDIQLLSQLTPRIRLYGADCNQSALVLEAIKQTKVNMSVYLGNYPVATDNGTAYQRQRGLIQSAIQTYGTEHIAGVTVGNEFMLNYVTDAGVNDPNSAVGNQGAAILISFINDTRSMLSSMNLGSMPVGNSDAGSYFNTEVLQAVDYGMANVHPWFGNVSINDAAGWTADFFQQTDVIQAQALSNSPKMYIAETGWPTKSSNTASASDGPSLASEANLQIFLDTFVCQANSNGTGYFYFEFYDETWKDVTFGGVEGWWGLFTANRTLKNIEIPNCQAP